VYEICELPATFTTFIVLGSSGTLALCPGLAGYPDIYGALKAGVAQLQCGGYFSSLVNVSNRESTIDGSCQNNNF
jgi:hypothetical protein